MDRSAPGYAYCVLAGLAALALSACVYWTEPLNTRVTDAATGAPVAGAVVAAWPDGREGEATTFVADMSGAVSIPSLQFFMMLPGDPGLAWPLAMRVDADGYDTLVTTRLGDQSPITLMRTTANNAGE